jgi:hypothetical protein
MYRLFSQVLPNHSSLIEAIELKTCSSRFIETLVSAFPPTNRVLDTLSIKGAAPEPSCVQAIAGMLRRNVHVSCLSLQDCFLDSAAYKLICDSIAVNGHVEEFMIIDCFQACSDTFLEALSERSSLALLTLYVRWTVDSFTSFFECLRPNVKLVYLMLVLDDSVKSVALDLIENVLYTSNFTLEQVVIPEVGNTSDTSLQDRINALLERNKSVRKANWELERRQYQLGHRSIWPLAMGRISRMPALVYRFMRQGNVGAFADHMRTVPLRKRHGYNLRPRRSTGGKKLKKDK